MTLRLRLLGRPAASVDDDDRPLRGEKAWLLLALVLRSPSPPSRVRLARLLFPDARSPDGALRWNLSHLRRRLGVELVGDPVRLRLPPGAVVDLDLLVGEDAGRAVRLPGLDDGLLAGIAVRSGDELARWLEGERRHVAKLVADVRREAALAALGRGDTDRAIVLAELAARHDPLDDHAAALLVRCLRAAARHDDARAAASAHARRVREALGTDPGATLWSALAAVPGGDRLATGPVAVVAQVEAGRASLRAGAVDTGLAALRSAVVAARALDADRLLVHALVELGSAMIHAVRDRSDDGVALLHEARHLAHGAGDRARAARACRELGYVDLLHGRYGRARRWFDEARAIADDGVERGWIDVYAAAAADDVGDRSVAAELLGRALDAAGAAADPRLEAYARTISGRSLLMDARHAEAAAALTAAVRITRGCEWTGLLPFPTSLLADAVRRTGRLEEARRHAEFAVALAEQVGDPCYEAGAARTDGLLRVARGDVEEGLGVLRAVPGFCRRHPDVYVWMRAWALEAAATATTSLGRPDAGLWVQELRAVSTTLGMRPFLDRADDLAANPSRPA